MGIWFWFVIAFIGFAFITLIRKWNDYSSLFTIAIGFAINANIFNASTAPMSWGPLVFSIDSILYTGFMFCVVICANEYGIRKAKILTLSTIAAILLSASIELFAKISTFGYSTEYMSNFGAYFFSSIGTFLGVWLMLLIFEKLKTKNTNIYFNIALCILISSIVNSTIYYSYTLLISQAFENFAYMLIGSYIGKIICINLSLISFYINTHLFIPNNLKGKYPAHSTADYYKSIDEEIS